MPVTLLFDGRCGLCRRSVGVLRRLDWLGRLQYVDYHDAAEREQVAPGLRPEDLDRSLHAIFPGGRILTGFDAFRALAWRLPPLWPVAPLLYLPGIAPIGRGVYAWIADRRKRCTHADCGAGG